MFLLTECCSVSATAVKSVVGMFFSECLYCGEFCLAGRGVMMRAHTHGFSNVIPFKLVSL